MFETVIDYLVSYVPNLVFAVVFVWYVGNQNREVVQTLKENNERLMTMIEKMCDKG